MNSRTNPKVGQAVDVPPLDEGASDAAEPDETTGDAAQGVQSLEIGLRIAFAMAGFSGSVGLVELAREVGLSRSKTHRYLVSLCRSGLVMQDGRNGRYDLAAGAVRLGLAAQGRMDVHQVAGDLLEELQQRVGFSSSAVVWGNHGPTIVRRKEGTHTVTVNTRVGSVLPVITSASGRVFAAFLATEAVRQKVEAEFAAGLQPRHLGKPLDRDAFWQLVQTVQQDGMARVSGDLLTGVDALAAPLFGADGQIVVTITLVGPHGAIDIGAEGATSGLLRSLCQKYSEQLGWHAPAAASTRRQM